MPTFSDEDQSDCIVFVREVSKVTATDNLVFSTGSTHGPIILAPATFGSVGFHNMEIVLWDYTTDLSGYTVRPWEVEVTNTAPYFNVPVMPKIKV